MSLCSCLHQKASGMVCFLRYGISSKYSAREELIELGDKIKSGWLVQLPNLKLLANRFSNFHCSLTSLRFPKQGLLENQQVSELFYVDS